MTVLPVSPAIRLDFVFIVVWIAGARAVTLMVFSGWAMMRQMMISGLHVGGVETFIAPDGRALTSGIRKRPVDRAYLAADGFAGDANTDVTHHTAAKTVHAFCQAHYPAVETVLGIKLPRPTFGENLTISTVLEKDVCVGDELGIGQAVICVTQPTERCKAIGRSLGLPRILKVLHEIEACGFYARVIQPGFVSVDDVVKLQRRPQPAWSILRLHRVMFRDGKDGVSDDVAGIPELATEWKQRLLVMRARASRGEPMSSSLAEIAAL